jgi:DNA polymerase-3 subunit delta'
MAIRFAQAVNCMNPPRSGIPCLDCRNCGQFERLVHPDLTIVEAEGKGGQIRIDQIREVQHGLHLSPYEAKYRVALLLRFEDANQFASNALLKTLENPLEKAIILITAESAESLLPTIVSRCEVFRLKPVPSLTLNQGIQAQWCVPPDEALLLTHIASGRPGYSFRLFQRPELLSQRKEWLQDLEDLLLANRVNRFTYVEKKWKSRVDFRPLLKVWLGFWRDVLLRSINSHAEVMNIDCLDSIDRLSRDVDYESIFQVVNTLDKIFDLLDHNINPRLAMEDLMLILPFNTQ